jgi:transcriptional regulator with XRE-family HTH domain
MAKPRSPKVVSHSAKKVREAMVANLAALIAKEYPGLKISTAYEKIESATGISLSSMQRITSGGTGPSVDTLADLAHHLGTTVPELLTPRKEALPAANVRDPTATSQRTHRQRP